MTMQEPLTVMDGISARQRELIRGVSLFADLDPAVPLLIISRCTPASVAPNTVPHQLARLCLRRRRQRRSGGGGIQPAAWGVLSVTGFRREAFQPCASSSSRTAAAHGPAELASPDAAHAAAAVV